MKFVNFITSDGKLVKVNPSNVETLRATESEWLTKQEDYDGEFTDIRFTSGQITSVRDSITSTEEKLRYGET